MSGLEGAMIHGGRGYLAIPGPSVVPDAVLQAMHRASPNIYEGEVVDMMPDITSGLKYVAQTEHDVAIYIGNGHAAWEAALANVLAPGDHVLVPTMGHFGAEWGNMAKALGAEVHEHEFGPKAPIDPHAVEAMLRADSEHRIRAVLAVHAETSTSLRSDLAALRAAIDAAGHPALLMADCIASFGCDRFEMDAWGVDVAVTASQKGLMCPPGLGFVFFGPRAAAQRAKMVRVSRYWDWQPRAQPALFFQYFGGTAPTHHLFGLKVALDMIRDETLAKTWERHARLAEAVWAACDMWGQGGPLRLNVADASHRSHAVTSLSLGAPYGTQLREWMTAHTGVTLGIGLGMARESDPKGDGFFRIGHMGHVNPQMILAVLSAMQAGFDALGIPYGRGALDAAAKVISGAS